MLALGKSVPRAARSTGSQETGLPWSTRAANRAIRQAALAQEMIDDYRKARGLKMSRTRLKPAMLAKRLRL